jgi:hypothetical protein
VLRVVTLASLLAFLLALALLAFVCLFRPPGAMISLGLLLLDHDITHVA